MRRMVMEVLQRRQLLESCLELAELLAVDLDYGHVLSTVSRWGGVA